QIEPLFELPKSINPDYGSVSFSMSDISGIQSYDLNYSWNGYWTVSDTTYTYTFNDTISEGLYTVILSANDTLNQTKAYEFQIIIDTSAPIFSECYSNPHYWNGLFFMEFVIDDASEYNITVVAERFGTEYEDLELTTILNTSNHQILLDTYQLQDGKYNITIYATDTAGNTGSYTFGDRYFDNRAPEFVSFNSFTYDEGDLIYSESIEDILYFNDQKYLNISTFDEMFDNFTWSSINSTIADQLGIKQVQMYYTQPLKWYSINFTSLLDYNTLTYEVEGETNTIKSIEGLKIGGYEVNEFSLYRSQDSLLIELDEQYSYLLSEENSAEIEALYYEMIETPIPLEYHNGSQSWNLLSYQRAYFNISDYLNISESQEFLFWFSIQDAIGDINGSICNEFITRKYTGIYDKTLEQSTPDSLYEWYLGENSQDEGIVLFGSESYYDSTIFINTSTILPNNYSSEEVSRIYLYDSSNGLEWNYTGRAYFSGEQDIWQYYWNFEQLDYIPPENYYLKVMLFDKAGNKLSESHTINIYDYIAVEMISDQVYNELIQFNPESFSNEFIFTGEISDFEGSENLWDIVAQYYNPIEREWIPLVTESAEIVSQGSYADYTIRWDINKDLGFKEHMIEFEYEYLPLSVTHLTENTLWGTWGKFGDTYQPILIAKEGNYLNFIVYEFNETNGWIVDTQKSTEQSIPSVQNEVFKLYDINRDTIPEIVRASTSQIDLLYFENEWKILTNITQNNQGLEYITLDIGYDAYSDITYMFTAQLNQSSEYTLTKFEFTDSFEVIDLVRNNCPENIIPSSIKFITKFGPTNSKSVLLGGLMFNSYSSQLFELSSDLSYRSLLADYVLGKISAIQYQRIDGINTILLGVERLSIGKMDIVVALKYSSDSSQWIPYEITDFDEIRFEMIDLLCIEEENQQKLIIAAKNGIFETKIRYTEDVRTITSPVCFTTEYYQKSELSQSAKLELHNLPIKQIYSVSYRVNGRWYEFSEDLYENSRFEMRMDLGAIWETFDLLKIAYSFLSFSDEKKTAIDPSFNIAQGTSSTTSLSVSSKFYNPSALPLLWLNPTSSYKSANPDWRRLDSLSDWFDRGINYQYTPLISGPGNLVKYPHISTGWNGLTGQEYSGMAELENNLADYNGDYESAQLSKDLSGDEKFEMNQYIDDVWISNPYISESYNFSELYNPNIHDETNNNGLYNYYKDTQKVLIKSDLVSLETNGSEFASVYNDENLPVSLEERNVSSIATPYGNMNSSHNNLDDIRDDSNETYIEVHSVQIGGAGGIGFERIKAYFNLNPPFDNYRDFYLTCRIETFGTDPGALYYNEDQIGSGYYIEIENMFLEDVSSLYYDNIQDIIDEFFIRIYYFELKEVVGSSEAIQGMSIEELELSLINNSRYFTLEMTSDNYYGFEYEYELPLIDQSIDSFYFNFDASINSPFISEQYLLSVQIYNYNSSSWYSLPLFKLVNGYYHQDYIDYDFWRWGEEGLPSDRFRPSWHTENFQKINTIAFGPTSNNTINQNGHLALDDSLKNGRNLFNSSENEYDINNYWLDNGKLISYESSQNANRMQLQGLRIDPHDFYLSPSNFPRADSNTLFNPHNFFRDFIANNRLSLRIFTEKEAVQDYSGYLCVGDANLYALANSSYLNYNNFRTFETNLAESVVMDSSGLLMGGYSGISLLEAPQNEIFRDNFNTNQWSLDGTTEQQITINESPIRDLTVRSIYPDQTFDPFYSKVYDVDYVYERRAGICDIDIGIGSKYGISGTYYNDDGETHNIDSEFFEGSYQTEIDYWSFFFPGRTYDVYYDITTDSQGTEISIWSDEGLIASTTGNTLSGVTQIERNGYDSDLNSIYIKTNAPTSHSVSIDWIRTVSIPEKFQTYMQLPIIDSYLTLDESDSYELQITSQSVDYGSIDMSVYECGSFTESLTWNIRPNTKKFISVKTINNNGFERNVSLSLGDINSQLPYIKLDTVEKAGIDFWAPIIKYEISKYHQEGGLLYAQTDISEYLTLKSDVYSKNTTLLQGDIFTIKTKTTLENPLNLTFYSDGQIQDEITIVPEGNQDFNSQYINIQLNETLYFDQLAFSAQFEPEDRLLVYELSAVEDSSITRAKSKELHFTLAPESNKPYLDKCTGSNPQNAFESDESYYVIQSQDYNGHQINAEFHFEDISVQDMSINEKVELQLDATSSVSLTDFTYELFNPQDAQYYEIVPTFPEDGNLIFTITQDQYNTYFDEQEQNYEFLFRIRYKRIQPFNLSIDSLRAILYQDWNAGHDLYRYEISFERLDPSQSNGSLTFGVNNQVVTEISDSQLQWSGTNTYSLNYDCIQQQWLAYLNNQLIYIKNDSSPEDIVPYILTEYEGKNEGIKVFIMKSNYYKRVRDETDFQKYKALISLYKERFGEVDILELSSYNDLIAPQNQFTQLSSDIEIIYSFKDQMAPNNVFDYSLSPTYSQQTQINSFENFSYYESPLLFETVSSKSDFIYVTNFNNGEHHSTSGNIADLEEIGGIYHIIRDSDKSATPYDKAQQYLNCPNIYFTDGDVATLDGDKQNTRWRRTEGLLDPWGDTDCEGNLSFYLDLTPSSAYKVVDPFSLTIYQEFKPVYAHHNEFDVSQSLVNFIWDEWDEQWAEQYAYDWGWYNMNPVDITHTLSNLDPLKYVANDGMIHFQSKVSGEDGLMPFIRNEFQAGFYTDYIVANYRAIIEKYEVGIVFEELLNDQKDYMVFFKGQTDSGNANLNVNGINDFSFGTTETIENGNLVKNPSEISLEMTSDNLDQIDIDYLYLYDLGDGRNITIYNDKNITIDDSLLKSHTSQRDSGLFNDGYFGKNNIRFTLGNRLQTPIFGRSNTNITSNLELDELDFSFDVYPNDFPVHSQTDWVEGENASQYNLDEINYEISEFKDSAIDEIQIPLITPIELQFDNFDITEYNNAQLELSVDLDIELLNRKHETNWSLRNRLVYYNYTAQKWEDFRGDLRAENLGVNREVYDYNLNPNALWYLQNPQENNFIPIGSHNPDLKLMNPFYLSHITNDTIKNGQIKLALISYILPTNFTNPNLAYSYQRLDPEIPIEISQEVAIKEALLLLESTPIVYPESTFTKVLDLNSNYEVNLTQIDSPALGEVVKVDGFSQDTQNFTVSYPLFEWFITERNSLSIKFSEKRELVDQLQLTYVPREQLVQNGEKYYSPNNTASYSEPLFISSVSDDTKNYGTFLHPDFPVNYTIDRDENGLYVDFTEPTDPSSTPTAAVHYAKLDDAYTFSFPIQDYLLCNYELLDNQQDLSNFQLNLKVKTGFNDVYYSELSQITAHEYHLKVSLYHLDKNNNNRTLGSVKIPLSASDLAFQFHSLQMNLEDFELTPEELTLLGNALTKKKENDLLIVVESSIANVKADAALFKGFFAQQVLDASISVENKASDLKLNGIPIQDPYITIPQKEIHLELLEAGQYQLPQSELDYDFEFSLQKVSTHARDLFSSEYEFNTQDHIIALKGNYSDYSGLLTCDINYRAFEWSEYSASSLEPITFNYSGNYLDQYTKYLEFEIDYNQLGIPGYEIRGFDSFTGKQVLSEEKKDAAIVDLYLYNYRKEIWDKVSAVCYEDFETTFSYVLDRNFIVFEDYFNKTSEANFDLMVMFEIDEYVEDYFSSQFSFSMDSIQSKLYYSPPSNELHINPGIEIDVDLSNYYESSDNVVEEVSIEFDYLSDLLFDENLLFEQYALIEENYNFYLMNQYLEYEKINLTEEDRILISKDTLSEVLRYSPEHETYYITVKIEYDWNCILQMNLQSSSKIEISALLRLLSYTTNIKYTSFTTTRISAFESDIPYQLTEIHSPNYLENGEELILKEDDSIPDIGFAGGFLRNDDTRQRLMIRQQLNYSFQDSLQGPKSILLDQQYNDYQFRFTKPTGYLTQPAGNYMGTSEMIEFRSHYAVSEVSLYYYNTITSAYQLLGAMEQDQYFPNEWTYNWTTIEQDVSEVTGEYITILVDLTDEFQLSNNYTYSFIADFEAPTLSISLGSGSENFESDQIATPFTQVSFSNSEQSAQSSTSYEWIETYTQFNEYMSHLVYPDLCDSTYSLNPLYMENGFPNDNVPETWNGWILDYDTSFTTSSFSNGDFESYLKEFYYNDVPTQGHGQDITMQQGSSDWNGNLANSGDSHTTFDSTPEGNFDYNYAEHTPYYEHLWIEDYDNYDNGYMSHTYLPDGYDSSYSMNPLDMNSEFPYDSTQENWNSWNLGHDSTHTYSSFANGDFNSDLYQGFSNDVPTSGDFTIIEGSLDSYGGLSALGNGYSTLSSTPEGSFDYDYQNHTPYYKTLWEENFGTFQSSYMSHEYIPDGYESSYSMNPLLMSNGFPDEAINENWNAWNVTYDSYYTNSYWNQNGGLSSTALSEYIDSNPSGSDFSTSGSLGDLQGDDGNLYSFSRNKISNINNYVTGDDSYAKLPHGVNVNDLNGLGGVGFSASESADPNWSKDTGANYRRSYVSTYWAYGQGPAEYSDSFLWDEWKVPINYNSYTDHYFEAIDVDVRAAAWEGSTYGYPRNARILIMNYDTYNPNTYDKFNPSEACWEQLAYWDIDSTATFHSFSFDKNDITGGSGDITDYISSNGEVFLRLQVFSELNKFGLWNWESEVRNDAKVDRVTAQPTYVPRNVDIPFNFGANVLDGSKDYFLYFQGKTNEGTANLKVSGQNEFSFGSSWTTQNAYLLSNPTSLSIEMTSDIIDTIDIDYLYLIRIDDHSGDDAHISKETDFSGFLNRYDDPSYDGFNREYEIDLSFDYSFTQDNADLSSINDATFILENGEADQQSFDLLSQGSSGSYSVNNFIFDSTSDDYLNLEFLVSNGDLNISNLNYYIWFKSQDTSDLYNLGQEFTVEYDETQLTLYERENGMFFIEITNDFDAVSDGNTYYNKYDRTNQFEIVYHIKADGAWYTDYYGTSTSEAQTRTYNVSEYMRINNLNRFDDFYVEFLVSGNTTQLEVSNLKFIDYRAITPVELEFTIDMELPDLTADDTLDRLELLYSHKSSDSKRVDLEIWDYLDSEWDLIDDTVYSSFTDESFSIGSRYYNMNNELKFRYLGEMVDTEYFFYIDRFKLEYDFTRTAGDNDADITKTISNSFLNRYDSFGTYQKLYEITIEFDYIFTKNITVYNDFAEFYINGANPVSLIKDGSSHLYSHTFEFDSSSENGFDVKFEISNGFLDLSNMHYDMRFKCLDTSGNIRLGQEFEVQYDNSALTQYEKENGMFFINTTYDFTQPAGGYTYYNKYGRTNSLEIVYHMYCDGQWRTDYYAVSSSQSETKIYNISEYMENNNYNTFEDFYVEYLVSGHQSELIVSDLRLTDYRTVVPTELEFTIDVEMPQITQYDSIDRIELFYTQRTTDSRRVYLQIKNQQTSLWETIDSSIYSSFTPQSYEITSSDYYNGNYELEFRYIGELVDYEYQLHLDQFKLEYDLTRTSGDIDADITKTITDSLLNRYDSYDQYQKLYDITIEFDYTFTAERTEYSDLAQFTIIGENTFNLIKDGNPHQFSHTFEFDSSTANDFNLKFEISNGYLDLSGMSYEITFKCLDLSGNIRLGQEFETDFNEEDELLPYLEDLTDIQITSDYIFTTISDGKAYYNSYGRTNKLEIILELNFNNVWFTEIYSTGTSETDTFTFNVTDYMLDNYLFNFKDFNITYAVIGDQSSLQVSDTTLTAGRYLNEVPLEQYRIIDLVSGSEGEWITFNSSEVSQLKDLADSFPANFSIEYRVYDQCGNVATTTIYNDLYTGIQYSTEADLTYTDDTIDLNSYIRDERQLSFSADFGDSQILDVLINGFNYGTAINTGGNNFQFDVGTQNNYTTMIGYSDSMMSDFIYSNVNPLNHIAWDVRKDDYYGVVKHVLVDSDIEIINPITYNSSRILDLDHLYERGFVLENYLRMKDVYYYNQTNNNTRTQIGFGHYLIDRIGEITFPEYSDIHEIYNNSDDVKDGVIYFEYEATPFAEQLRLTNADGFFINISIPAVYYKHTTIEKLTVRFNDATGKSFAKVFMDLDLRNYFLSENEGKYNQTIFGMGKMMSLPLYIDINELSMSNPHAMFDLSMLESITFTIADSQRWPGSFLQDYGEYEVLNLPYQKIALHDIKLYNTLGDSIDEDENGFITSQIEFRAPDYYNYYAKDEFKYKRIQVPLTDVKIFYNRMEIGDSATIEYSDEIEVYYKFNNTNQQIPFDEISTIPLSLIDYYTGESYSHSNAYYITKHDELSPEGYYRDYYYSKFSVPQALGTYSLSLNSIGTPLLDVIVNGSKEAGWWTLGSETLAFDRANNNDGTVIEATTESGKVGNALSFDGSNDRVELGNPEELQITGSQTIAMWLYPTQFTERRNPYAKAYGGEGTITLEPSGSFNYYYGTSGENAHPYQGVGSSGSITLNEWSHICLVRDLESMKIRWYIDGDLTYEVNADYASATASSLSAYIGQGYVDNFAGKIDDLRIYDSALTPTEVSWLYNEDEGQDQRLYGVNMFNITVIQESLNEDEPIYLEEDNFELEYGDSLLLRGTILDNDQYIIEDEVYQYNWQEALDGETSYTLDIVIPEGDEDFIDTDEIAIYYLTPELEKIPIYVDMDEEYFKNNSLLDYKQNPEISFVENEFIVTVYWNPNSATFINYDTNILLSYKVLNGKPIQPISYSRTDEFGNSLYDHLVEVPFARYNM
ncbi:MAG: hypothetical protein GF311_28065, partial [Candidatus Lokiarchaeota archaeon]|nr:hypothetical protein [Candidatus Lokiarchaeota archaeon]